MRTLSAILISIGVASASRSACAQQFFGGGVVAFDPEISTVSSGVVMDVQPTVTYDRKYVNINMQAQDSRVIALHNFQVASGTTAGPALGFVGGVTTTTSGFAPADPARGSSPDEIDRWAVAARSVLSRRGMFLLRVN